MLITYQKLQEVRLGDLKSQITAASRSLSDMTVFDIIESSGSGHGVYVFSRDEEIFYVGKSSSRSFIERIPAHFDTREDGWFNTLTKQLRNKEYSTSLEQASEYAKSNLSLTLIEISRDQEECKKVEKFLRLYLRPALNHFKENAGTQVQFDSFNSDKDNVALKDVLSDSG